jgi:hypothetical protein
LRADLDQFDDLGAIDDRSNASLITRVIVPSSLPASQIMMPRRPRART